MAITSILLSLITLFTFWLVLPLFLLPPVAFILGLISHRANRSKNPTPTKLGLALSVFPMFLAVVAFWFGMYIMNTEYRA